MDLYSTPILTGVPKKFCPDVLRSISGVLLYAPDLVVTPLLSKG